MIPLFVREPGEPPFYDIGVVVDGVDVLSIRVVDDFGEHGALNPAVFSSRVEYTVLEGADLVYGQRAGHEVVGAV